MTDADVHYNSTTTLCTAAQPCVSSRISSFDPNVITQHSEARCGFGGSRATCMCGSRFTVSESQDTGSEGGVWGVWGGARKTAQDASARTADCLHSHNPVLSAVDVEVLGETGRM